MWMVDNNDHSKDQLKMSTDDSIFGRKLRPLMPRPISSCTTKTIPFSTTPCCCYTQNPNILPWNHPISGVSDYGVKREIHTVPLVSTRWNPTPEQLQALEEMYRRGTRTPSAEQIQQIAARLRRFGKIEGKNVFYWFQNHKARERQKKRRQIELLAGKKIHHVENKDITKQTELSRKYFEIENNKKLSTVPSNCSTPSEDSVSMHGSVIAECKKNGWTRLDQKELHKISTAENETFWPKLDLSSSVHTINSHKASAGQENTKENQTLQLFPIGSNNIDLRTHEDDVSSICIGTKSRPNEFIEFLPIKK